MSWTPARSVLVASDWRILLVCSPQEPPCGRERVCGGVGQPGGLPGILVAAPGLLQGHLGFPVLLGHRGLPVLAAKGTSSAILSLFHSMQFHSVTAGCEIQSGETTPMWKPRILSDDCNIVAACPETHGVCVRVSVRRPPRLCRSSSDANSRTSSRDSGLFLPP